MIIEVTGPSGAGKTTFITTLIEALQENGFKTGAIHSAALNESLHVPQTFADLSYQNWRTDLKAFPWMLLMAIQYPAFCTFCLRCLLSIDEPFKEKISILRSLVRKLGIFRYLNRRKFKDTVVCVDEGIMHSAHNLLVTATSVANGQTIKKFEKLCPKSDIAILLFADNNVLISRLNDRGDISPRVSGDKELFEFVKNANSLFDSLFSLSSKERTLLAVDTNKTKHEKAVELTLRLVGDAG